MPRRDPRRIDEDDGRPPRRFDDDDDRRSRSDFPVWILLVLGGGVVGLILFATLGYFLIRPARVQPRIDADGPIAAVDGPLGIIDIVGGGQAADRIVRLRANASPQQLIFGGTDDGYVGVLSFAQGGYEIEVFRTSTGEEKGRIVTKTSSTDGYTLSPDGAYVAEVNSAPFEGNAITIYRSNDGQVANKFTPYPRSPRTLGQVPALSWIRMLPGEKLLTINERGGYDVWSVPDCKRLHGKEGKLTGGHSLRQNGFTQTPTNFAITPDGKTLALFDGSGFTFVNPITGAELGRTEPFTARGQSFNSWGCAITSDGNRLAFHRSQNPGTTFTVWDVKTGKQVSEVQAESGSGAGFCWWGKDHVLIQQGGIASADVVSLSTGRVVAKVRFSGIGKLGPTGPGDALWSYTEGVLIRTGAPPQLRPDSTIEISPTGVQVR
jgi:hypothetical protein